MATCLLAWNPNRWPWNNLDDAIDDVVHLGSVTERWSCGTVKNIRLGDRAFLIRLGVEPKGLMASGTIVRERYEELHYDPERAARGDIAARIDVRFDTLLDPSYEPLLAREFLMSAAPFSAMHWDTRMSGVRIPDDIAAALERTWAAHTLRDTPTLPEELPDTVALVEGAHTRITINAYERNPEARRRCLAHHGTRCVACGFDFHATYGPVGKDLIHVHHLRPLATVGADYMVDPVADLRPVCPNCHAIIHRHDPPYSIETVRSFLRETAADR